MISVTAPKLEISSSFLTRKILIEFFFISSVNYRKFEIVKSTITIFWELKKNRYEILSLYFLLCILYFYLYYKVLLLTLYFTLIIFNLTIYLILSNISEFK